MCIMLPLFDLSIKYFNPFSYDDIVVIETEVEEFTKLKVKFIYNFYSEDRIKFAESKSTNVFTDINGKLKRIDNEIFVRIKEEK